MMNLECLFGFHAWGYRMTESETHFDIVRNCARCNKLEFSLLTWGTKSVIEDAFKTPERWFK